MASQHSCRVTLKASLVYSLNSRTARATQRNPVSKDKKQNPAEEIVLENRRASLFWYSGVAMTLKNKVQSDFTEASCITFLPAEGGT